MNISATPAFIDFEASSLDLVASYPIEVGICLADGSTHSWLIEPHRLWQEWSDSAQRIHGIHRDSLYREGLKVSEVARHLNEVLPSHVYCDAWTFDRFWLHRLYRAADMAPTFQLESVAMLLNDVEIDQWSGVRARVINQLGVTAHRAANDALILHETWKRIAAQRPDQAIGNL